MSVNNSIIIAAAAGVVDGGGGQPNTVKLGELYSYPYCTVYSIGTPQVGGNHR